MERLDITIHFESNDHKDSRPSEKGQIILYNNGESRKDVEKILIEELVEDGCHDIVEIDRNIDGVYYEVPEGYGIVSMQGYNMEAYPDGKLQEKTTSNIAAYVLNT